MHDADKRAETTLDRLSDGESGVIRRIWLSGPTKKRLIEMGVTPGARVRVLKRAPLGDPIEITLRGYTLTLRLDDARRIGVELEEGTL